MAKLRLIFGTINSLPLDLSDAEIEKIYQRDYKPFIAALYNFPQVASTFHFSGAFLAWLDSCHPEFVDVLAEMAGRKQAEMLGGAFYDPLLPLVPRTDRIGQFEKLTTWLRKKFGSRPRGSWIGETEWEPSLASAVSAAGMDYTFLGEEHFSAAGISPGGRFEPYITEDQGETLTVFPLFDGWGQELFSLEPREILEKIEGVKPGEAADDRLLAILVDGKVFGGSAEGHKKWYKEKKLEELFGLLRDAGGWLEMIHPGKHLRQSPPRRKAYFPCGSRTSLMYSALSPEEKALREEPAKNFKGGGDTRNLFFPGGFSRRFLVRYPEAGSLYAKMQYTHILVSQIRGDKYRKASAREELWKAQQGFAYWPSPRFGGIYRNSLRKTAYEALISAEKLTRQKGVFIPSIVTTDFDFDRRTEYLYQGDKMNAYVHTLGARLFELDYLPACWNYLDTFSPPQDEGGPPYPRKAFIDHFFGPEASVDNFGQTGSPGDFTLADSPFDLVKCDRERSELVLEYAGAAGAGGKSVRVVKKFIFKGTEVNLYYTVTNTASEKASLIFGSEINFSFLSKKTDELKIFRLEGESRILQSPEKAALKNLSGLVFEDLVNDTSLSLSTLEPAELWSLPVESPFTAEEGELPSYQASCVLPRWKFTLAPEASWENRLTLRLEPR